ncbi:MAG TPA: dihydrofolate reductase family protein [Capillimicrobium sp.]|jgi:dihydrofolate reductase
MSALLYSATMSLDGFIAGPGGDMSWLGDHLDDPSEPDAEIRELMASIGALLIGNRTFRGDDPNQGTDAEGAFGGQWQGPSIVLTHDPPAEHTLRDTTFATDLESAVRGARQAAGGKRVNVLGADVARQCLEAGHLDEILVFVAPVLLGDGTRLFAHPGGTNVRLEPMREQRGSAGLWYRVGR